MDCRVWVDGLGNQQSSIDAASGPSVCEAECHLCYCIRFVQSWPRRHHKKGPLPTTRGLVLFVQSQMLLYTGAKQKPSIAASVLSNQVGAGRVMLIC